jgi:glycosyltransferase involved in cell wall biosynthesis
MKVIDVSFWYDTHVESPSALLAQHFTIEGWMKAVQNNGVEVAIVKRFKHDAMQEHDGIKHYFIKDGWPAHLKPWQIPFRIIWFLRKQKPDVLHVHGFMFPMAILFLRLLSHKHTAIIIQHHAGVPPNGWQNFWQKWCINKANGYFFTTVEHGKMWFHKHPEKIMPVMEGSIHFTPIAKDIAKTTSNFSGNPVFLWVGRLDDNKDPITVLEGFDLLLQKVPTATLYMLYTDELLISLVKEKLLSSSRLQQAVHLVGKVNHQQLQAYYSSADYFVLGSHHEGSGFALAEALACGCVPIITDIPSFRMMTNNGQLGALWQCGNSENFYEAAKTAMLKNKETESKKCIEFFEQELSFKAIGNKAVQYYQQVSQLLKY